MENNNPFKKNKHEIFYKIINSALAGMLVLLGSLTNMQLTFRGVLMAFIASCIVFVIKFKEYWDGEAGEYSSKLFSFVR